MEELKNSYEQKVLNLINLLKDKTIVFDFDGVMTEFKYASDRLLPCKDDNINEYHIDHNIYENAYMLETTKYVISKLDVSKIYILTVSQENVEKYKNEIILKTFPGIDLNKVIHVRNVDLKNEKLKRIYEETNKEIIFIEDTASTLLKAEEELPFVKGYHISSLLP